MRRAQRRRPEESNIAITTSRPPPWAVPGTRSEAAVAYPQTANRPRSGWAATASNAAPSSNACPQRGAPSPSRRPSKNGWTEAPRPRRLTGPSAICPANEPPPPTIPPPLPNPPRPRARALAGVPEAAPPRRLPRSRAISTDEQVGRTGILELDGTERPSRSDQLARGVNVPRLVDRETAQPVQIQPRCRVRLRRA